MGRPIVYCQGCGTSLREEDFEKGRAQMSENRALCAECKPIPAPGPPPVPPTTRKVSSQRIPIPPITSRRAMPPAPKRSPAPLLLGGGAALAVVALVVALSTGERRAEPPPPPPRPSTAPAVDRSAAAVAELERLAKSTDAEAILARCDVLRPALRGTPHEGRLRAVEERARELRKHRAERFLGQIRELIASGNAGERKDEIERMLKSAEGTAGVSRGEVDRLRAELESRLRETGPVELLLTARAATLTGGATVGASKTDGEALIQNFNGPDRTAEWELEVPREGTYRVELTYAVAPRNGGEFTLTAGGAQLKGKSSDTGGWEALTTREIGTLPLSRGPVKLVFQPTKTSGGLMNIRRIRLVLP